jgi:hypothetical protein
VRESSRLQLQSAVSTKIHPPLSSPLISCCRALAKMVAKASLRAAAAAAVHRQKLAPALPLHQLHFVCHQSPHQRFRGEKLAFACSLNPI